MGSQDVTRGMCVVKPKSVKAADHFVAQVYLMTPDEGGRKKPCTKDMQLICFSKTWDCAAYVELEGKEMAMPGEDATMKLRLLKPMVLEAGQHFTIRDHGGTIGTGKVTDIKENLTDADEQGEEGEVFGQEGCRNCISWASRSKYPRDKIETSFASSGALLLLDDPPILLRYEILCGGFT